MPTRPNWVTLTSAQQSELESCVKLGEWRVIPAADLPSIFPERLRAKIDSAFVIAAATSTGGTYLA